MSSFRPVFRFALAAVFTSVTPPQLVITVIFFICLRRSAAVAFAAKRRPVWFSSQFVGLAIFVALFTTVSYLDAF